MPLRRVLVANRGEIAVRIVRACADEGVESVVVVSDADRDSMAALLADRAVCIGPGPSPESYLDLDRVVCAALATGCDALHPGYGFLAERPELAQACAENEITFVGPDAQTIRRGGDKVQARAIARSLGVPVGCGSEALTTTTTDQMRAVARRVGFPVLLKAAAGGGGRGMVLIERAEDLAERFATASHEAQQAFGDGRIYLERFVDRARHVEVQVLGDAHGNVIHLGERDCTVQRRYQKVLEEAPATAVSGVVRDRLYEAALAIARELRCVGAATVEFIVDAETNDFAFLEVNTRVQVEHPVTELLTGVDIVREQLRIASGQPLIVKQSHVRLIGHAVECRVNAEDPRNGFLPAPGTVTRWIPPQGGGVRVDSHVYGGYRIPPYYDSLIAKVITCGETRAHALTRMSRALHHLVVDGVRTNRDFLLDLINDPDFVAQRHHTRWVEETFMPAWTHPFNTPTSIG